MGLKRNLNRFVTRVFTPVRVSFVLAVIFHFLLLSSMSGLFAFNDNKWEETVSSTKLNFKVVQTLLPVEQTIKNNEVVKESRVITPQKPDIKKVGDNQKPSVERVDREAELANIVQGNENEPKDEPKKAIDQGKEQSFENNIKDNSIDSKDDGKEKTKDVDSIEKERDEQSVEVEEPNNSIDEFPPGIGKTWDGSNQEIEDSKGKEREENKGIQRRVVESSNRPAEKQESSLITQETNNTVEEITEQTVVETRNKDDRNKIGEGNKETNGQAETDKDEVIDLTSGKIDEGIVLPELSNYKKPLYPEGMRKRGIEGRVILEIIISNEGKVVKVEVKDSSGYEQFDNSAKDFVKEWLFQPASRGEENLACRVLVPVIFRLN